MEMATTPLRAAAAARELGISTRAIVRLVHERKIRFVMLNGIAHIPPDAIAEYRAKAS
jgi:excisionase family DNA binding protein